MANFGHGGNAKEISRKNNIDYEKIIDFSANINPLGISEKVKKRIIDNINVIEKYPDINYFELKNAISRFEKIRSEHIFLGNGAAEVLFNIIRAVNPKKTLIMAPTFSEYEEAVECIGKEVELYYLKEENEFKIQNDIMKRLNRSIELIIICNPNNPTGVLTKSDFLIELVKTAKKNNIKVLVDESFLDFIKEEYSVIKYTDIYDNLIIMKSLTKFFALPGLRIGYGICSNTELNKKIALNTSAWNINAVAEEAAKCALEDKAYIAETTLYIDNEREYLYNELLKFNSIKVFKPCANFIFFKLKDKIDLFSEFLQYNILIRSCSNYNGIDDAYYRIAIRAHEDNVKLIKELHKILKQH